MGNPKMLQNWRAPVFFFFNANIGLKLDIISEMKWGTEVHTLLNVCFLRLNGLRNALWISSSPGAVAITQESQGVAASKCCALLWVDAATWTGAGLVPPGFWVATDVHFQLCFGDHSPPWGRAFCRATSRPTRWKPWQVFLWVTILGAKCFTL